MTRLVFGEDPAPREPAPAARPERARPVQTYPPFDLEGRPRCMECGALAIRDGTGECRDCRDVRLAEKAGTGW